MGLSQVFDSSLWKIIDFLLENSVLDYSKKEIAEGAGVARSTLYRKWHVLEDLGIVKKTRKYQKTQLYTLNKDSDIVNKLGRLKMKMKSTLRERKKVPA